MVKAKAPERERTAPHPLNRNLFVVDNLKLLRNLDADSVDLVVTDPPFAKNDTFRSDGLKPALREEEISAERELLASWGMRDRTEAYRAGVEWPPKEEKGASYSDTWNWKKDVHDDWIKELKNFHPKIWSLVRAAYDIHSEGHAAYLAYMAVRLIEVRRVLKPTGSIYLHCDHTAAAYLKMLMDAVFGKENFRNEIIWSYNKWTNASNFFQKSNDIILFYGGEGRTFNKQFVMTEGKKRTLEKGYGSNVVEGGVRQLLVYDPEKVPEHVLSDPKYHRVIDLSNKPKGVTAAQVWTDINYLAPSSGERTGYPTQKPVALAERIIRASSNPGDVVLDPFAGCAYVPVAAEGLGRQWIACDISIRALTVVKRQFNKFRYSVDGGAVIVKKGEMEQAALLAVADVTVKGPNDLPERAPEPEGAPVEEELPDLEFAEPDYFGKLIDDEDAKVELLEASGYRCWCCGFANRYEDGEIIRTPGNFHLDHVDPSSGGGLDYIYNRSPLCAACNLRKGGKHVTLKALRDQARAEGRLSVRDERLLPDIAKMQKVATDLYSDLRAKRKAELGF